MKFRSLVIGCLAVLAWVLALNAQSARPQQAGETAQPPARAGAAPQAPAPASTAQVRQTAPASAPSTITADAQRAFFKTWCIGCHNQAAKATMDSSRKLQIDTLDPANVDKDRKTWELLVRKVRAGQMPPSGSKRPEPALFDAQITALENELDRTAKVFAPPPGLHRMNRTEYANVIRDLLDLEIDAAKYLPSDDSTAGFDNIAGALGVSSTLVEAYVNASQKIARLALGYPEEATLVVYRTKEDTSQDYHIEGLPFGTRGGMLVPHVFPSDGEYTITVTPIFGDNMSPTGFGSVPCEKLEILLDGDLLGLLNWQGGGRNQGNANCGNRGRGAGANGQQAAAAGQPAQAAAAGQPAAAPTGQAGPEAFAGGGGGGFGRGGAPPMRVRFKTTAGKHLIGATYLATNFAPLLDLDRHFMRSTVQTGPTPGYTFFPHVGTIRIEGPYDATPAKNSASRRKIFTCTPKTAAEENACARRIITNLTTYAFRRPAAQADVNMLMAFYEQGRKEKNFETGIEMVLARILASPQFIYRIEEEPAQRVTSARGGGSIMASQRSGAPQTPTYRLNDLDLASRLSFFLWSSIPDEELLKVAAAGRLKDPAVLEQQVRRMLKDPKAEALAVNFAGQWLNLRALDASAPLPLIYPDFDDPLRQAMRREVELLFDTIVREDHDIAELLNADYTFVNERLAKHYGIKNVYGSQFRRVTLGPGFESRRGLTGKGAFLVTSSKPDRTSPVTRGKWVMTNLLGMSPPSPPADVPPLKPRAADPNAKEPSMREKMMSHRVRQDCVQCHRLMDPIGFSLENFDAIGLWRTQDEGQVINAKDLLFDNTTVDGPVQLRDWLGTTYRKQFTLVAVEKLLTYALGRGVEAGDMPLVRAITRDVLQNNGRFSAIVLGIVRSQPFQANMKTVPVAGTSAQVRPSPGEGGRATVEHSGVN
jgi:mono/diheme cytochrome c family protein